LGYRKIASIKVSDIKAFYNELYDVRRFTVGTIGTIHRILNQLLEFAADDDLIRRNPAKKAYKAFTVEAHEEAATRKTMTVEEQDLFEDFLEYSQKYNRWQPLFTVMLWTGIRAGELTALRWEDVDFEKNIITIDHNLVYVGDEQLKNGSPF
jgi:integrase